MAAAQRRAASLTVASTTAPSPQTGHPDRLPADRRHSQSSPLKHASSPPLTAGEGEGSAVGEDDDVPFEHAARTFDVGARLVGEDEDVPFEHAAQTFDVGARLVGEVAQGALTDLANLAVALAQEDGGRRVPVGNGLDIHGGVRAHPTATYKSQILYCMAMF